ncbi:tripartite tricarboxylate transporter TctB family protein [Pseudooceanicola sp. CBS1P-1]|uniref:DUF1468 domain-containing protein n=1 Tax=Pseudooceanicola albus TaxID=2692189 RepID=A0A6L7G6C6_9RHOB|nr:MULTISPECIES: tripartite tricarboxylate transporter TctB family protein [Pseudooceanicola]MBT9385271.1 tripartite tricarboxylate transporter TctB family protein [Pseudooceanicola endophyticus]MXN18870.1 hypothetical protein [Pseudooceanicola albus]
MLSGKIFFDLALLVLALGGAVAALNMPQGGMGIGPGAFPGVISGLGVAVMLALLWQDLRAARTGSGPGLRGLPALGLVATAGLLGLYVAVIGWLGFLPATIGFLFLAVLLCTRLLEPAAPRPTWKGLAGAALFSVLVALASYLTFTRGFGLVFP